MSVHGKFSRFRRFAVAGIALLATVGVAGESTVSAWAQTSYYPQQTAPNYSYQQPTTQTPGYSYQQPYGSSSYPTIPPRLQLIRVAIPTILTGLAQPGHRIIPLGHLIIQPPGDGRDGAAGGAGLDGIPVGGAAGVGVGAAGVGVAAAGIVDVRGGFARAGFVGFHGGGFHGGGSMAAVGAAAATAAVAATVRAALGPRPA